MEEILTLGRGSNSGPTRIRTIRMSRAATTLANCTPTYKVAVYSNVETICFNTSMFIVLPW